MIVNAYADAYIADGIRATVQSADERGGWMEARLQDLRAEAQAAADAAEQFRRDVGVADQQGLRELEQQAEALERSRAAGAEPLPRTGARKLLPGVGGPHPVARPAAARSHRPACHPCACGGGLPGPSLGLAAAVLREARETGFRTAAMSRGPFIAIPGLCAARAWRRWGLAAIISGMRGARWARARAHARSRTGRAPRGRPRACPHAIWPNPAQGSPPSRAHDPTGRAPRHVAHPAFEQAVRGVFAGLDRRPGEARRTPACRCSPWRGGGRSAIALELAQQSCHAGRRCLLVDADLAAAGSAIAWALARRPARCDVLDGTTGLGAAVHGDGAVELDVLPIGQSAEAAPAIAYLSEFGGTDFRSRRRL
jgi:hypothetical protein